LNEILLEITSYLYYEYKFDITALSALSLCCCELRRIIDLNGKRSPVTSADRARRQTIYKRRGDDTIQRLMTLNRPNDAFLITIATYNDIVQARQINSLDMVCITSNPLITIEILDDLIAKGIVDKNMYFRISYKSVITYQQLESRGLQLQVTSIIPAKIISDYKLGKSLKLNPLLDVNGVYTTLLEDDSAPLAFLCAFRDQNNLPECCYLELNAFLSRLSLPDSYRDGFVAKYHNHYIFSMFAMIVDLEYILKNPSLNWPWNLLREIRHIDMLTIRNNPQCAWVLDNDYIAPVSNALINAKYQRGELTTADIIDNPNINWNWKKLAFEPYIDIDVILPHLDNVFTQFYRRDDITIEHVLKYHTNSWNFRSLSFLQKYRAMPDN